MDTKVDIMASQSKSRVNRLLLKTDRYPQFGYKKIEYIIGKPSEVDNQKI